MDTRGGSVGDRSKRRIWSEDEKLSICQQTTAPGVSVAQVARRYSMNANLIFKWLRDPRYAPAAAVTDDAVFLPITIDQPDSLPPVAPSCSPPQGRIEIELSGGHRISAEGGFDPDALARLLKGLIA
ncbi:transposase [Pelagibius sp. Alg239-R121]|uniref:IS66-like element accessory protein TnpA n=1 Tax=Pelagibius sp. Alg239-R121 TaxID=2993448 RepID=UPI0034611A62